MSVNLFDKIKNQKRSFNNMKNTYIESEMTFDMYYSGSTMTVVFEDGKKKKQGHAIPGRKGMFLAGLTNKQVKKRIESGEYICKNTNPSRMTNNTIMYSSQNIKKNLLKPCVAIDISSCYWRTAYNIGVIDQKLYDIGMSGGKDFKEARVISIGSIGALVMHEKYVKGQLVSTDNTRRFGANARLDIIDAVWLMANKIASKLGSGFLMYLTDCFYAPESMADDLCRFIKEEGYDFKIDLVQFEKIERMHTALDKLGSQIYTEKVIWFSDEQNREKMHDFSNIHDKNF
jgi:hypothetical protein